jgi:dimethylaniline monooxygenase (N-oxide forming)
MSTFPTTAIIGAGSSGIAVAKELHERGLPFQYFEASDRIGGNWVLGNKNGMSAAYRGLHINTSRAGMEYSDFSMPKSSPDFPEPAFPGSDEFGGVQMHAHDYRDSEPLRGKDVVVLGMGNSAMDIAVESSYVARTTHLAARRGAWIVPKYLFGKPMDQLPHKAWMPERITYKVFELFVRLHTGNPERYGLLRPDHRFGQAHPTVSGQILDRIIHGTVTPQPNIARLGPDWVQFADGTRVHADVVVYCTGYRITFPFFDADFLAAPDNRIELFRRVFVPGNRSLAFAGLLQPLGAVMPLAEAQGRWLADYLLGRYHLPPRRAMETDLRRANARMRKRYVASKRHTIQVDFDRYLVELGKELRRGAERARAAGFAPPLSARPAAQAVAA